MTRLNYQKVSDTQRHYKSKEKYGLVKPKSKPKLKPNKLTQNDIIGLVDIIKSNYTYKTHKMIGSAVSITFNVGNLYCSCFIANKKALSTFLKLY